MWNYLFMLIAAGAATFLLYNEEKDLKQNAIVAGVALVVSYLLFVWLAGWSSTLFTILLMAAAGFVISLMYEDFSLSTRWKPLAIAFVVSLVVANLCGGGSSSSYDKEGYKYAVQHLKAPSTAVLQSYITKSKMRKALKDNYGITYSKKLEIESFKIEATNGFGGRLVSEFFVIYWKGNPVMCDHDCGDIWFSSGPEGIANFRMLLSMNAGLESDDIDLKINK